MPRRSSESRGGSPQPPPTRAAFSLVEVVIAVGIFGFAIVSVLGLLPALTRSAAESTDALTAQHLPAALEAELHRSAVAAGLESLAASIPIANAPLQNGAAFVASRDGARLVPLADSADLLAAGEAYFFIEVWRFPTAPLLYENGSAVLAGRARASWPYKLLGAAAITPPSDRSRFEFNLAIN